jgi:osmotically-inducible protein OsmY
MSFDPVREPGDRAKGSGSDPENPIVHGALGCPSLDEMTQQDVCSALLSTPELDARRIEVEMTGAGVLLRGEVSHSDARSLALRIARALAAPRPVKEALTVKLDVEQSGARPSATARVK